MNVEAEAVLDLRLGAGPVGESGVSVPAMGCGEAGDHPVFMDEPGNGMNVGSGCLKHRALY